MQLGVPNLRVYLQLNESEIMKLEKESKQNRLDLAKVKSNMSYEKSRILVGNVKSHQATLAKLQEKLVELGEKARKIESDTAAVEAKSAAEVSLLLQGIR